MFFLDYVLILKTDMTLSEFKYSMLKDEVNLGEIIIFFCLFAFFLSFFVPLIRFLIFQDIWIFNQMSIIADFEKYSHVIFQH